MRSLHTTFKLHDHSTYPHLTHEGIGLFLQHGEIPGQIGIEHGSVVIDICHHHVHSGSGGLKGREKKTVRGRGAAVAGDLAKGPPGVFSIWKASWSLAFQRKKT